jgi:uncharacterized protein (TIGR02996 family)
VPRRASARPRPQSPKEIAFLRAIVAAPDDDTPRLVFADWLDEHGDADRAAFIRVQCQLARLPADDPNRQPLLDRQRQLLERHERAWRAELPRLAGVRWGEWQRGFIVRAEVANAKTFREQAAHLFAAAPVQILQFERLGPRGVGPVVASPLLVHLDALVLGDCLIGPAGARAVAKSPHLARLTGLYLTDCGIGSEGAEALARSPHLRRLRRLNLWGNDVGDAGVRALAASPVVSELAWITLAYNQIGDAGAQALAASPHLGRLEELELRNNDIGDAGAEALASSTGLAALRKLDLVENHIGKRGAEAFARSAIRHRLQTLWLGR